MISSASTLLPNGKIRRVKRPPPPVKGTVSPVLPMGLLPVPNVSQGTKLDSLLLSFSSEKQDFDLNQPLYFSKQIAAYVAKKTTVCTLPLPESATRQGFTLNRFRSGELTGARFCTGLESASSLPTRSGVLVTQSLTQKSRTKIRRAIQNAEHDFRCFLTVTFAPCKFHEWQSDFIGPVTPWTCKPWEHNSDGSIRQDFAKYKFKKFLHSIKVAYDRKAAKSGRPSDSIAYVWVAEIQLKTTNNIHFHVLLNHRIPIKWLTALWSQASNSIDVRSINNLNHASCYIRKYMEKDKSEIQGNRYAITQGLRASMQSVKTVISGRLERNSVYDIVADLSDTIHANGGKVLDHGFYLPAPSRSVLYRGKDGRSHKTTGVNSAFPVYLLQQISEFVAPLPF